MKLLVSIVHALLYSNVFIALGAVSLAYTNQLTGHQQPESANAYFFLFSATIVAYWYLKQQTDDNNEHRQWSNQHPQLSRNIFLLAVMAAAVFFFRLSQSQKLYALGIGTLTAVYGVVYWPHGNRKINLRNMGLLKPFIVAAVWCLSVTFLIAPSPAYWHIANSFLLPAALCFLFELKDADADARAGIYTWAHVSSGQYIKGIVFVLLAVLIGCFVLAYINEEISATHAAVQAGFLLISFIIISLIKKESSSIWYYGFIDGLLLLQAAFAYCATLAENYAG